MQEAVRSAYNGQGEIYLVSEFEPALAAIKSVEPARKPPKVDAFIANAAAGSAEERAAEEEARASFKKAVELDKENADAKAMLEQLEKEMAGAHKEL